GGCPAGTHGFDVLVFEGLAESCEPRDEDTEYDGHGTHVAGILGAVGNNGMGVAGMNWHTTILPVKWLDEAGEQERKSTENLVKALKRLLSVIKNAHLNVRVVNDSDTLRGTEKSS